MDPRIPALMGLLAASPLLPAQTCEPRWAGDLWSDGLPDGAVRALAVFDDGSGPALWIATEGYEAGPGWLGKWDGERLAVVASTLGRLTPDRNGGLYALHVHDDGSGPRLHVGGNFTSIAGRAAAGVARLEAGTWHPVGDGADGMVRALATFDSGAGPDLFAAGFFQGAGGVAAPAVTRWSDGRWEPLGAGLELRSPRPGGSTVPLAYSLTVFDDGRGEALYVGGTFDTAGGLPANHIARWDGRSWEALGAGLSFGSSDPWALALHVLDEGPGPALFVGGRFDRAGGQSCSAIARWDGRSWSCVGAGVNQIVTGLTTFDAGLGPMLAAAVYGGVRLWNGADWIPIGQMTNGDVVRSVGVFESGPQRHLYAGGRFWEFNSARFPNLCRWDGTGWSRLTPGGANAAVSRLRRLDDGAGARLYAAGEFAVLARQHLPRFAEFDGQGWRAVQGQGLSPSPGVADAAVFDDGSGPSLHIVGVTLLRDVNRDFVVARRRNGVWEGVPGADNPSLFVNGSPTACRVLDDGSGARLFVLGRFNDGHRAWDGRQWTTPGGPILPWASGQVYDAEVYADGPRPTIFTASSVGLRRLGPTGWEPDARLPWAAVFDLLLGDDGSGWALFAAGRIQTGQPHESRPVVARLLGSTWTVIADSLEGNVLSMDWHDDGAGRSLYVTGSFNQIDAQPAEGLARWDGTGWEPVTPGLGGTGSTIAAVPEGSGESLWIGGDFRLAGGLSSGFIARRQGCATCPADCDHSTGRGVLDVFDFLCFQNRYEVSDPFACGFDTSTGPGRCDVFDFLAFLNAFGRGCP